MIRKIDPELEHQIQERTKKLQKKKIQEPIIENHQEKSESNELRKGLGQETLSEEQIKNAKHEFNPFEITKKYSSEIKTIGSLIDYQMIINNNGSFQKKLDERHQPIISRIVNWDSNIQYDIKRGLETYDSFINAKGQRESINEGTIKRDYDLRELAKIILQEGIVDKVSDIMIAQYKHFGIVKFSKGPNSWYNQRLIYKSSTDPLITIFKDMAGLKITLENAREPQTNGSINFKNTNFRVATGSNQYGMFIVLRRQGVMFNSLDELDFPDEVKYEFRNSLKAKDGLIIVGGPVGSGKTTLMTTGLIERLHQTNGSINVISLEKPIETPTPGIIQEDISDEYHISWSNAIQAALREMPTILRVGEVNEEPAAQAIVKAANSGVIAMTTLHIKSTLEVFETLKSYGISENDIKNSLRLVIYLNRVPRLCPHCKIVTSSLLHPDVNKWIQSRLPIKNGKVIPRFAIRNPKGCEYCRRNQNDPSLYGTLGKISVYELLKVNQPLLRIWRQYREYDDYVLRDKLLHPETIALNGIGNPEKYENSDDDVDLLKAQEIREKINKVTSKLVFYPLEQDILDKIESLDIDIETAKYLLNE